MLPTRLTLFRSNPFPGAAALPGGFAAGTINKDAAHCLGGRSKEVAAAIPVARLFRIDQAEVRFMHQGRGLKRLPGLFLRHPFSSQFAQFVVDQRQQLLCGVRVALLDGSQDAGDIGHGSARIGVRNLIRRS